VNISLKLNGDTYILLQKTLPCNDFILLVNIFSDIIHSLSMYTMQYKESSSYLLYRLHDPLDSTKFIAK
jgi:hypothetical protein